MEEGKADKKPADAGGRADISALSSILPFDNLDDHVLSSIARRKQCKWSRNDVVHDNNKKKATISRTRGGDIAGEAPGAAPEVFPPENRPSPPASSDAPSDVRGTSHLKKGSKSVARTERKKQEGGGGEAPITMAGKLAEVVPNEEPYRPPPPAAVGESKQAAGAALPGPSILRTLPATEEAIEPPGPLQPPELDDGVRLPARVPRQREPATASHDLNQQSTPGAHHVQGPGENFLPQEEPTVTQGEPTVTAYLVGDIVEAQTVMPEENIMTSMDSSGEKEASSWLQNVCHLSKKKRQIIVSISAAVVILLIVLGTKGVLKSSATPLEATAPTSTQTEPEGCLKYNCWLQLGPDLKGPTAGKTDFGDYLSLSKDGLRFAISDTDWGSEAGVIRVYEINGNIDSNASMVQLGNDMVGSHKGDKARGSLSGDGNRLVIGAPLNDGPDRDLGKAGEVRLFELHNGNWTVLGDSIYGVSANERSGFSVALSKAGGTVAFGAPQCQSTGCVRIHRYNNRWEKVGDDILGDGPDDNFGLPVSISEDGTVVAAAAKNARGRNGFAAGLIRVYALSEGFWSQLGNDIEGLAESDHFGHVSLSSDGMTLVGHGNSYNGYARVFSYARDKEGESWFQVGDTIRGDQFGGSLRSAVVSGDGQRIAIVVRDTESKMWHVRVLLYDNHEDSWHQLGGAIEGRSVDEKIGSSLALSEYGNRLVVGGSGGNGVVRVYEMPWTQTGSDLRENAVGFGHVVSLAKNGECLAVSAPSAFAQGEYAGTVFVYDIGANGSFARRGQEINGLPGDRIYGILSRDGRRLVVGARRNDGINGTQGSIGQVRVFGFDEMYRNWTLLGSPLYGDEAKANAGKSIDLSHDGSIVAFGGHQSGGRGKVWAYQYTGEAWKQLGQTIEGTYAEDNFGWSVSLSAAGTTMVVGARHHSDGGLYYERGHIQVFDYDGHDWTRRGLDIDGLAEEDLFGVKTAISADGNVVAGGAYYGDGAVHDSGHVRVFAFDANDDAWHQLGDDISGSDNLSKVSLSADGTRIVVSSDGGLDDLGYVRVYDFDSVRAQWQKVGGTIPGRTENEGFGYSTSISEDGTMLVAGASEDNPNDIGVVRLFSLPAT